MNKLNGGYVMLKYDASQEKIKDAYESGKPVIVYDSNNKGLWAKITESSGTYSIEPLITVNEAPSLYMHIVEVTALGSSEKITTIFYTNSETAFTKDSLKDYIKSFSNSIVNIPAIGTSSTPNVRYALFVQMDVFNVRMFNASLGTSYTSIDTLVQDIVIKIL